MPTDPRALFRAKAPDIMRRLMADFNMSVEDAAAVLGNLGHESGGFKFLQELKPMIPGSAGGYGWAQWTGPRRRAYEAYCARNNLDPASDKANYGFLFVELTGSEKKAVSAVKKAKDLRDKVVAFELAFERAGIKHYNSRIAWATIALNAYRDSPAVKPQPKPDKTKGVAGTAGGAVIAGTVVHGVNNGWGWDEWRWVVAGLVILIGLLAVAWMIWRKRDKPPKYGEPPQVEGARPPGFGADAAPSALESIPMSDIDNAEKSTTGQPRAKGEA